MKVGFSLFLKEFVKPDLLDYDDCRIFQIICPECKEPVYKVCREYPGKTTHFFSHYKKDETLEEQCELRVNSISREKIDAQNNQSRGQSLDRFLQVFQDIIWKNEYNETQRRKAKQIFHSLSLSKTFLALIKKQLAYYREIVKDKNEILDMFDESIDNIHSISEEFGSKYALQLQKEYAYDFFQHILAGNSKSNYFFLIKHGFIKVLASLKSKKNKGKIEDWELLMYNYLTKFVRKNNEATQMNILEKMMQYEMISPYSSEDSDLFTLHGSYMMYNAFAMLMRIPYLNILKENIISNK